MAGKKESKNKINVRDIRDTSGDVNIAGRDIIKGWTAKQVSKFLKEFSSTFQLKPFNGNCPYKGLDVFEEHDAELFFGREKLVDDLINRVRNSRSLFITGPSGSGKSSLVRAGLVPALRLGKIKGSDQWLYETIKPGRDPIEALALAFSRLKSPELANYFRQHVDENNILNECAESALSNRKEQKLILFIDQFEEVFTQVEKDTAETFIAILATTTTIKDGRAIILFSMRSDFVTNCASYPNLNNLLNQQFIQIGAMQPEELVKAIALPAMHVGLRIDPALVSQIIDEMEGEPGVLPLMQFALKDLFDSQQEKSNVIALTRQDYLQRGGIHEALDRHANKIYSQLSKEEMDLARSIFSGLVDIGNENNERRYTKRTAQFDELIPVGRNMEDVKSFIYKLADPDVRLLTTDQSDNGKEVVTISHEKLIDAWQWLNKLVNDNRDIIVMQNEISSDAKDWKENNRDYSYLYRGARLNNAQEKIESKKLLLSGLALEFIEAGIQAYVDEISKEKKRANTALARQLAAEAQSLIATQSSNQFIAVLLAIQAMKISPSFEIANLLQHYNLTTWLMPNSLSYALSPNEQYLAKGNEDGTVIVENISTGKEKTYNIHGYSVNSILFSPNGKLIISGSDDKTACVWDAKTGKIVSRMIHDSRVTKVAFSPDGLHATSGCDENIAIVWEAFTGKMSTRIKHDESITALALSSEGEYLVSGSKDNTARLWKTSTGKEITRTTHNKPVTSVDINFNRTYAVSGSVDNTARVWDISTGKELAQMIHDSDVNTVVFSPDGKYVASGSDDFTARVWNALTGKEVARMPHDSPVFSVNFSLDGKYVISKIGDKTVTPQRSRFGRNWSSRGNPTRKWLWHPDDLINSACAFLPRNLTRAEWAQYVGDALPYQAVCENLPIEPECEPSA